MDLERVTELLKSAKWEPVDAEAFAKLAPADQLQRIQHSSAHVLASATLRLFPDAEFAWGPATGTGFFYDMVLKQPLGEADLPRIQAEMDKIAEEDAPFMVTHVKKEVALDCFRDQGTKLDILERIPDAEVSLYKNGSFIDLCAGPHVPHTGLCKHTKLLTLAAAHWRDERDPRLTRVTGTAWSNAKDLRNYLRFLEESKRRDHRVLGPQLGLFTFHPWAASALWHPKGLVFRKGLIDFWAELMQEYDYIEILNPQLYHKELFQTSGHWEHFQQDMFVFRDEQGEPEWVLKPMNCPDTMLYYRTETRSYRDLPMRVAEGQVLHRNERSGTIHGIMRTRNFVQDDAHIFLAPSQIADEIAGQLGLLDRVYGKFGLSYSLALSTRPEGFLGEIELWNEAEAALKAALERHGEPFALQPGEGSFYGPKIDVSVEDSLGRAWQCGTIQLDFQLPLRFELSYTDSSGNLQRPVVVHRAIFGSLERFVGVLVEHFAGAFPTWISPVQVSVLPVSDKHLEHCEMLCKSLRTNRIRYVLSSDGSINKRIRDSESKKIPHMLVVGDKEVESGTVTARRHRSKEQQVRKVDEFVASLKQAIDQRQLDVDIAVTETPLKSISRGKAKEDEY